MTANPGHDPGQFAACLDVVPLRPLPVLPAVQMHTQHPPQQQTALLPRPAAILEDGYSPVPITRACGLAAE